MKTCCNADTRTRALAGPELSTTVTLNRHQTGSGADLIREMVRVAFFRVSRVDYSRPASSQRERSPCSRFRSDRSFFFFGFCAFWFDHVHFFVFFSLLIFFFSSHSHSSIFRCIAVITTKYGQKYCACPHMSDSRPGIFFEINNCFAS